MPQLNLWILRTNHFVVDAVHAHCLSGGHLIPLADTRLPQPIQGYLLSAPSWLFTRVSAKITVAINKVIPDRTLLKLTSRITDSPSPRRAAMTTDMHPRLTPLKASAVPNPLTPKSMTGNDLTYQQYFLPPQVLSPLRQTSFL